MSAGVIVLWRHGRTAYNAEGRIQGQVDIPLDEIGRWQIQLAARALAARLAFLERQGGQVRIVSSDLLRASATAAALGQETGLDVALDARLRERGFGAWEGKTRDEITAGWPQESEVWRAGGEIDSAIGAETTDQVTERMHLALRQHAEGLNYEDVLVAVSHGAAIGSGLSGVLDVPKQVWNGLDNAHWAVLVQRNPGPWAPGLYRLGGYNHGPEVSLDEWRNGPIEAQ